jgi:hypothetical protein
LHPPIQFFDQTLVLNGGSSAANELENQGDYRQNQQYVYEPAQRVAAYYSQQPEHEQNYKECPKHLVTSASVLTLLKIGRAL